MSQLLSSTPAPQLPSAAAPCSAALVGRETDTAGVPGSDLDPTQARHPGKLLRAVAAGLLAACPLSCAAPGDAPGPLLVLAAASTIDALEGAVQSFESAAGIAVSLSFGPTSTLARQIEGGAPADLMLSASGEWADYVEESVAVERRRVLVGNRLVLIGPRRERSGTASSVALSNPTRTQLLELFAEMEGQRFAIADPEAVPAGIYARQALRALGLWERLGPDLVPTVDVRAALALVASRETGGGLVYASDARGDPRVASLAIVPAEYHEPIEYPLMLLAGAAPEAAQLFDFLVSDRGRAYFLDRGFTLPGR